MTVENIQYLLGLSVGVVIWFLKGVMADFKAVKLEVIELEKELGILQSEQSNTYKRFDKLDKNFETLTAKIDMYFMKTRE